MAPLDYTLFGQLVWVLIRKKNTIYCICFQDEERHRRALWEENKKIIEKHNAEYEQGKTSYTMGLNQFSDMVSEKRVTNSVFLHFGSLPLVSWFSIFLFAFPWRRTRNSGQVAVEGQSSHKICLNLRR